MTCAGVVGGQCTRERERETENSSEESEEGISVLGEKQPLIILTTDHLRELGQINSSNFHSDFKFLVAIVQLNPGCFGCDQVILKAVGQAGSCLSYASEELRADPAIALAALSSDVEAFEFVAPRLWEDSVVGPIKGDLRICDLIVGSTF